MVFLLYARLVFSTQYRRGVLTDRLREFLHLVTDFEAPVEASVGEDDHVSLLVCRPPEAALSRMVDSLKGASSRVIRKEKFPEVTRHLWGEHFWSPSDCVVSCVGTPLEIIKKYVEQQRAPDRNRRTAKQDA